MHKDNLVERLTPAQLSATIDALNFVLAGAWDEDSHEHRPDTYERALDKLLALNGRVGVEIERVRELEAALIVYGRHAVACNHHYGDEPCDCGFAAIVAALRSTTDAAE